MEKNVSVATLQILGGHPSLDFPNTVSARRDRWGPDLLATFEDLVEWSERTGLLTPAEGQELRAWDLGHPAEGEAALARAKRLREALYEVFSAVAAGSNPPDAVMDPVRKVVARAQASRRLVARDGRIAWEWPEAVEPDSIIHRIAVHAVELLTGPQVQRVKECFGRNCGWLFLDLTRNGSRRWCSDADCGTLDRVTRHRQRNRAKPACQEV